MAVKHITGFEINSLTNGMEMTEYLSATNSLDTSIVKSGVRSHKMVPASGYPQNRQPLSSSDNQSFTIIKFDLYIGTIQTEAFTNLAQVYTTGYSRRGSVRLNTDRTLSLVDEDGVIGTTAALNTGQWYRIEVKWDRTPAAGSHVCELKVDGASLVSATNRNISSAWAYIYMGFDNTTFNSGTLYLDNVVISDNSGSFFTSYPGAIEIVSLHPNAAGDNTQWTPSTGNNWDNVEENPPNDATNYNYSTTNNQIDDLKIEAVPSAIDNNDTIDIIAIFVRYAATSASSNPSFVVRCKASAGGTVEESGNITPASTSYFTNANATNIMFPPLILYDLPGASTTVWTKNDLETAQIGYRISVDGTNTIRISNIWMTVGYTKVAGVAAIVNKILQLNQAVKRAAFW